MSKRTWDIGGGRDPKRETNKWSAPDLEPGGVRDWTVYGFCLPNIFTAKYETIEVLSFLSRLFIPLI